MAEGKKKNNTETFVSISKDNRLGKVNLNSCSGNSKMVLTEKDLEERQKSMNVPTKDGKDKQDQPGTEIPI